MKTKYSNLECIKKVLKWWEGTSQFNVLNGINFYNCYSEYIFYTINYYNTNVCEHQKIIVRVNKENGSVTIKEEKE